MAFRSRDRNICISMCFRLESALCRVMSESAGVGEHANKFETNIFILRFCERHKSFSHFDVGLWQHIALFYIYIVGVVLLLIKVYSLSALNAESVKAAAESCS